MQLIPNMHVLYDSAMNIGLKMTKVKMTRTKFAFTTNYCSFSPFRWNKPEKTKATDFCIELTIELSKPR